MGEEHSNWGFLWSDMQWRRQFIVILAGKLEVYTSEDRICKERKLLLAGATVKIVDSTESGKASLENISKSHFWRSSCINQNLPEPEGAIVIIKSTHGKKLFILASNQREAEVWKTEIEKAAMKKPEIKKKPRGLLLRIFSFKSSTSGIQPVKSQKRLRWEVTNKQSLSDNPGFSSVQECTSYLRISSSSRYAFEVASTMVDHFNAAYQMGDCSLPNELRIEAWKGTLSTIVRTLRDALLIDNSWEEDSDKLWMACETWVMAAAHDKIMGACEQMFAVNDKELNIILSKLRLVDPTALGITSNLRNVALGEAIQVFANINAYRTPLEKAVCLRRTVNCVLEGIQCQEDNSTCTDDLLSVMLLLMSHAKVQHLQATSCYMDNFFQIHDQDGSGELRYHITNFVAACTYLSSEEIKNIISNIVISPSSSTSSPSSSNSHKVLESSIELNRINTALATSNDSSPEFLLASTYV